MKLLSNKDGSKYYINDQLPDIPNEKRHKATAAVVENRRKPVGLQHKLSKGSLMLNNEVYICKVQISGVALMLENKNKDWSMEEGEHCY